MVPTHMFLTRGVGVHKEKLASFEQALRSAGVAYCNLVSVSSILPPNCKIIPRKRGEKLLNPGEITFCVMARSETNERNRLVSASIGLAIPTDRQTYGYLSEHHAHGVGWYDVLDQPANVFCQVGKRSLVNQDVGVFEFLQRRGILPGRHGHANPQGGELRSQTVNRESEINRTWGPPGGPRRSGGWRQ